MKHDINNIASIGCTATYPISGWNSHTDTITKSNAELRLHAMLGLSGVYLNRKPEYKFIQLDTKNH